MVRRIKFKVPTLKPARLKKLGKAMGLVMKGLVGASLAFASPAKPSPKPRRKTSTSPKKKPLSAKPAPSPQARSKVKAATPATASKPAQAGFTQHRFASAHGGRDYKLYVPPSQRTHALPLVVMLHGCTQSPDDFATGTGMNRLADKIGFLVAYPAQSTSANASKCWNWFKRADQQRGAGEPSIIAGITRQVIQENRVDPSRVYVAGLSAGGAAAAIMAEAYPDIFAAAGIHSGVACGAASDMISGYAAMTKGATPAPRGQRSTIGIPLIVFQGDNDRTVHASNADAIIARRGIEDGVQIVQNSGTVAGAQFTRTVYADRAGRSVIENWRVHRGGHAWFGGNTSGSYATSTGPNASAEMVRFFLQHALPPKPKRSKAANR